MRRWLTQIDPTALGMVLALLSLLTITPPWTVRWRQFLPEEVWVRMTLSAALTVVALRPRSWLAWGALATTILWSFPDPTSSIAWHGKPWLAVVPYWDWERLVICRELGTILCCIALVLTLAMAVKALDTSASFGLCAVRGAIALAACIALSSAADYLKLLTRDSVSPEPASQPPEWADAIRVSLFILPALAFAALLWRKFTGVIAWTGASLASMTLAGLPVFYANKMEVWEYAPIALLAAAGPLWAWWNWRTTPREFTGSGFEVAVTARLAMPPEHA